MNGEIAIQKNLEEPFLPLIDTNEGWRLIESFSNWIRESGTEDEYRAAEYIVERLRSFGVPVTLHEPNLLISLPRESSVEVSWPGNHLDLRAKTSSFSLSTNGEPVSAEIVHVPAARCRDVTDLFDVHLDSSTLDVRGKVVLTEGFAMPTTVRKLERMGAVGQIYINPGRNIHEGICTTIWGTPTPENIHRKPSTPVTCINRPDGERLLELLADHPMQAAIRTRLEEGWRKCLLPEAVIEGQSQSDEFLLVHGHYDSWHEGIGDNATGDATLLELARIFHAGRRHLKRSLRIAWWPAHSTGRYAGSTWYADQFALELRSRCVGQVNIDSPGCRQATAFEEVMWMQECDRLCRDAIRDRTGQESRRLRPLRAGDYSFNQIGLSSFFMLLSNQPRQERERKGFYPVGGCGGDIAWHTEDDTLEVADRAILEQDLGVYVTALARVANAEILPYDFRLTVEELMESLKSFQKSGGEDFSLMPAIEQLQELSRELEAFYEFAAEPHEEATCRDINHILIEMSRLLVPVNYALGERFDHDPAEPLGVIPKLQGVTLLGRLEAGSDACNFLRTELTRQRNKVANSFYEAASLLRRGRRILGY